jgi:two-component system sensor histidine kinase ChiS
VLLIGLPLLSLSAQERAPVQELPEELGLLSTAGPWDFVYGDWTLRDFDQIVTMPYIWNYEEDQSEKGIATYSKTFLLSREPEEMGIYVPTALGSYVMMVDDVRVARHGVLADGPASEADYQPESYYFRPDDQQFTVTFFVSNYHDHKAGFQDEILIGDAKSVHRFHSSRLAWDSWFIGALFMLGAFELVMFLRRRKNLSSLYLSSMALAMVFRSGFTGQRVLYYLFTALSQELLVRLEFMVVPLMTIPFLLFLLDYYCSKRMKLVKRVFIVHSILWAIATIVMPYYYTGLFSPVYEIPMLLVFVLYLISMIRPIREKKSGAKTIFIGLAAVIIIALNDVLYEHEFISTGYFMPLGLVLFIIIQSVRLGKESAEAFQSLEDYNANLLALEKLRSQIFANVSHELRTPLHGILGLTESLLEEELGEMSPNQHSQLELIYSSGRRLETIVANLFDFSRLREGNLPIKPDWLHIGPILEALAYQTKHAMKAKNLSFRKEYSETLPEVWIDGPRTGQILFNLMDNAIKYTDKGGITLGVIEKKNQLEIYIQDTGVGIDQGKIPYLLETFSQDQDSDTRLHGGVGLGLALAKEIATGQQSELDIQSKPGDGTRVSLLVKKNNGKMIKPKSEFSQVPGSYVALAGAKAQYQESQGHQTTEAKQDPKRPAPEHQIKPLTILAVDDEPLNLKVLGHFLTKMGHHQINANSGPDALALLEEHKFDLVFLDIMMPGMSGYEVLQNLREKLGPMELPVIMVTAKNQSEDLVKAFALGANDYITKPFNRLELQSRMQYHTENSQDLKILKRFVPQQVEVVLPFRNFRDLHSGQFATVDGLLGVVLLDNATVDPQSLLMNVSSTLKTFLNFLQSHQGFLCEWETDRIIFGTKDPQGRFLEEWFEEEKRKGPLIPGGAMGLVRGKIWAVISPGNKHWSVLDGSSSRNLALELAFRAKNEKKKAILSLAGQNQALPKGWEYQNTNEEDHQKLPGGANATD